MIPDNESLKWAATLFGLLLSAGSLLIMASKLGRVLERQEMHHTRLESHEDRILAVELNHAGLAGEVRGNHGH